MGLSDHYARLYCSL